MQKRSRRLNIYFDPDILKQLEARAARRDLSKSALVETAVLSFLTDDAAERQEAATSRRLDRMSRQIAGLEEDISILAETLTLFIRFWLTSTPPLPESARASARAMGLERFEGFLTALERRLATGDRFLRERSRDIAARQGAADSDPTE
ncbi:ribbon-helix-helix protein, CopG family [Gluconacetobacter aggeris]|uniref:Ribbon-helix-helix protein, CopG family n=1 Tax=Gluconacetobacter aggeris TaxID=1286186 RepID=A0A7W4IVC9_9PROT|nr:MULTISPECIES: CopG family transcriptional regulator [Acetobacteraceae]MBB2169687.1 ribbon-helix-helix protein, CopG family [Gluconacetobacter aggeris]WRH89821.1 CopG family transcriptional regulator [Nguyenibacter sp. L1]